MVYVQFYQKGVMTGNTIEACGDRSVAVLHGNRDWMWDVAAYECEKRGFTAWRLFKGDSFTRSTPISPLMEKLA
jgi:hypothetical protein